MRTKLIKISVIIALFGLNIAAAEPEPNGTFSQAIDLEVNTQITGTINDHQDIDIYKITLPEPGKLRVLMEQDFPAKAAWKVKLFQETGELLTNDSLTIFTTDLGLKKESDFFTEYLAAGVYYLWVADRFVDALIPGRLNVPYRLTPFYEVGAFFEQTSNEIFDQATKIVLNREYEGAIHDPSNVLYRDDIDFFTFELPVESNVTIALTQRSPSNAGWRVSLFPDGDTRFFTDQDALRRETLSGSKPAFEEYLAAGKYYLRIKSGGKASGVTYFLSANTDAAGMPYDASGYWIDPERPVQSVSFIQSGNVLAGTWFTYDDGGNVKWFTFANQLQGTNLSSDLFEYTGPAPGVPCPPCNSEGIPVGKISINFHSPWFATMDYQIFGRSGTQTLVPLEF